MTHFSSANGSVYVDIAQHCTHSLRSCEHFACLPTMIMRVTHATCVILLAILVCSCLHSDCCSQLCPRVYRCVRRAYSDGNYNCAPTKIADRTEGPLKSRHAGSRKVVLARLAAAGVRMAVAPPSTRQRGDATLKPKAKPPPRQETEQ